MPGQGKTICLIADAYSCNSNWDLVYKCVPNTPHLGVVPISTPFGASAQRYPDVVATNGAVVSIVEIELRLTPAVASDIVQRFKEMREALTDLGAWSSWRSQVHRVCRVELPIKFLPICTLVLCHPIPTGALNLCNLLLSSNIAVKHWTDFDLKADEPNFAHTD